MPFALPACMLDEKASAAVWTLWYGSLKAARQAAERAPRRQSPAELETCHDLRTLPPFTRLSRRLDLDLFGVATSAPGEFHTHAHPNMPLLSLMPVLECMIGSDVSLKIYQQAMTSPAPELALLVEAEFPFMAPIHRLGILKRSTSQHLLGIAALTRKLASLQGSTEHEAESNLCRLLIAIICRTLPDRLGSLAGVTNPVIASCFAHPVKFAGITSDTFQPGADIWQLAAPIDLSDTAMALHGYEFTMFNHPELDRLITKLDRLLLGKLTGDELGLEVNAIYQDFLGALALPQHGKLIEFIANGGEFFAAQPYAVPADMVRPGFSMMVPGREHEAATALFTIMVTSYAAGDISSLIDEVLGWRMKIEKVGKKLSDLGGKGASQKNIDRMKGINARAMTELDEGRVWFVEEAMRVKPLVDAWQAFYRQLSAFSA